MQSSAVSHRAGRRLSFAALALTGTLLAATLPSTAVTVVTAPISGKITDNGGKNLVDPWCVYFWPEDATAPGGWARSSDCIELTETGSFSWDLPVGRYKVEVEATNVAYGMFAGGGTPATATILTVTAKGLRMLKLKVATLAMVSGRFTDTAGKSLVNPNCVYFWFPDATAEGGWTAPDECAEIDPDGYFNAYVMPGKYKLEVQADNVALGSFFGGQNTLATATQVTVPAGGLSKQVFAMPTQPPFAGKVTALDGSLLPTPDAIYMWTEDPTAESGWSVSGDIWDMDSKGNFSAYLVPKKYRIQIVYGSPKVRTFFGGPTIETATTFRMPTGGVTGLWLRTGKANAPAAPTGVDDAPRDGGVIVAWDAPPANTVTYMTATAQPGGAFCATATANSCTITGLKNGTTYSVEVTATNESGSATTDAGTVIPAIPVMALRPVPDMVLAGGSVSLGITNGPLNAKVTVSGKPGSTVVTTSALGNGSATFTLASAGLIAFTATAGKASAKASVYVPSAKFATTAKRAKAASFSLATARPGAAVVFSASNGQELTGTVSTKGAFTGTITFPATGTFTVTATVGGLRVGSGTVTVTP